MEICVYIYHIPTFRYNNRNGFQQKGNTMMKKYVVALCISIALCLSSISITAKAESVHNPVVFAHGISGASYDFTYIQAYLVDHGWNAENMFAIDFSDTVLGRNSTNGPELAQFVDNVLKETGANKVDIVAHSMGGANTLFYLKNLGGNGKVEHVVTLGGANRLGATDIIQGFDPYHPILYTSIYSTGDQIVANGLSKLKGAENVELQGIGHVSLLNNEEVNQRIVAGLNREVTKEQVARAEDKERMFRKFLTLCKQVVVDFTHRWKVNE